MNESPVFDERLKAVMSRLGINQAKLCELTGLSSAQANYLANGRTKDPKLSTACKIAIALDVSLDYLGGLIDEPRPIERDENGNIVASDLTNQEDELIDLYRDANAQGKATILGVARLQPGMEEQSAAGMRDAASQ